jgi:hypothetical protein
MTHRDRASVPVALFAVQGIAVSTATLARCGVHLSDRALIESSRAMFWNST